MKRSWKAFLFWARSKGDEPRSEEAATCAEGTPLSPVWRPIDFEGLDTSLTQAELALLK